jgi:uncharacterized protein YbjQ (UPF0145 family)
VDLLSLSVTPVLMLLAWMSGTFIERRHLKSLHLLEGESEELMALTIEDLPAGWEVESCDLVMGNVVISQDYFKRVAAALKGVFGGNIRVLEPLLERARREAVLRMKAEADARGHDTIINVRIETSPLAGGGGQGRGVAGVEILAFGTAVSLTHGRRMLPRPEP